MAAMLAIGITACGTSNGSTTQSSAATAADADRDAHLRVGFVIPPPQLNPHRMASDVAAGSYLAPLYDRLTQFVDGESGAELAPMVATEWTFAEDEAFVEFTLRDDVTFSDGSTLNAEAVKRNFDHALAPESTVRQYFTMIDSVEVVDANRVRFNTNRPAADLPSVLAGPAGSLISPGALDNPDLDVNPVGSGPYTAKDIRIGDQVTYERRDGYWDADAQMAKEITIRGITDENSRLNALRSGQLDLAYTMVDSYEQASKLGSGFGFYSYPPATTYAINFNVKNPGVDNVKFRQALNFAVDRDSINTSLLSGQCTPNTQPLAPENAGHLEEPTIEYSYDPERAKQLLQESGVTDPTVKVAYFTGMGVVERMASALQAQLGNIGVTLETDKGDTAASLRKLASGEVDGYLTARVPQATDLQTLARNYTPSSTFFGTPTEEFNSALMEAYSPSTSDDDRVAAVQRAADEVTSQAYDLFICSTPTQFAFSNKVIGADNIGVANFQGVLDTRYVGIAK